MSETSLFRAEHVSADDSGDIQTVSAMGHASESFEEVIRVQPHGFTSNPPKESHGAGVRMRGESDLAMVFGMEHPDYRVQNLAEGDSAFYNHRDKVVLQTKGDDLNLTQPGTFNMQPGKSVYVKIGGVTFTIDKNGVAITGGKVTHNGHDIGDTHKHTDAGGSGLSGVPE